MRLSLIILFLTLLSACGSNKYKITGIWKVESLSEYPLSVTNYDDITFDAGSTAFFSSDNILQIFLTDTTSIPETLRFNISNSDLTLIYGDYGIPLNIEKLTEKELILIGGGFGNSDEDRSRSIKLKFRKKNSR